MTPWIVAGQAPVSMGFSRQEYWSGLPSPPPGDLPGPEVEPTSLTSAGGFFTTESPQKPRLIRGRFKPGLSNSRVSASGYHEIVERGRGCLGRGDMQGQGPGEGEGYSALLSS